ncbi:tRNA-dihydrouridine synthase [Patescibacteria group bacterium]|nr:tRNA-dihydrouridine synthase [Patescibacteria group bacterium]
MNNFWQKLNKHNKPFFALAPMADVTDAAFRQMIAKYSQNDKLWGGPQVFYTEFVSVDGLTSEKGRNKVARDLYFSEHERPIIAQVFGTNPEKFMQTATIIQELGFDGIDINMGCPEKKIIKQGAGAALIKTPELAKAIIKATKDGAIKIPVSVKTRIGYNKIITNEWISCLLEAKPDALAIHGRTQKEMSDVPAHWDEIKKAAELAKGTNTIIIGNGDVTSLEDGTQKASDSGVDGIMVGRGVFGNPWFFNNKKINISKKEKIEALIEHTYLFEELLSSKKIKGFEIMKKHFKAYTNGFDGARELRVKLMEAENAIDVKKIINNLKL